MLATAPGGRLANVPCENKDRRYCGGKPGRTARAQTHDDLGFYVACRRSHRDPRPAPLSPYPMNSISLAVRLCFPPELVGNLTPSPFAEGALGVDFGDDGQWLSTLIPCTGTRWK